MKSNLLWFAWHYKMTIRYKVEENVYIEDFDVITLKKQGRTLQMIEALLIFMLALRIGDMGTVFWMWLVVFAILKFIRFVIWLINEN